MQKKQEEKTSDVPASYSKQIGIMGGTPKGPVSAKSMFAGYNSRNNNGIMKFKSSQIKKSNVAHSMTNNPL